MLDDTLPVSLQYQLRNKLLEKITEGIWPPSTQIPSERELCEEYGVSRMTVREVLKDLAQEGYLIRKRGKGTFVALPEFKHELTSTYSLSEEIEKEGLESKFQILSFRLLNSTTFLQQNFGISANEKAYELIRLRFIDDELFAWERAYIPYSIMEDTTEEQIEKEGLYPTIFRHSGLIAENAEVEATAINCPDEIAELLHLQKNAAVFYLTRLTMAKNRCIEYCESYIRSEKYKYKYKQTLKKKANFERVKQDTMS
ncbi:GntR family transcriptional regulator [Bacillus sp. SD088]|uniref:GntR family transcriptional regulator n=1 Tax=Bacillus sp. SD088 TaxID=2782012 RepID=UPI001A966E15|nr:GntR family transcriptional regulator [Bacillus sp. SD088]MBO0993322.1 GntR family transcriptional regulator [Bacillus sp. SD088]